MEEERYSTKAKVVEMDAISPALVSTQTCVRPVHVYTDTCVLLQRNTQLVSNSRKHRRFHVEHSPK